MTPVVELTYRTAMDELEELVARMRTCENIDVDDLVTDVSRAKELIDFCGEKIKKAELQIENVVQALKPKLGEDTTARVVKPESAASSGEEEIPF